MEDCISQKQKKALSYFIGIFEYDKKFNPKDLDGDLVKKTRILNKKIRGAGRNTGSGF